jgi:hypothetical protein
MRILRRALVVLAAGLFVAPSPAAAQFGLFGPNKVQYRRFDWRVLRGEHVDLYFYPEEEELARVALTCAEDAYAELSARFRHSVTSRVPLLIYASHYDFEQTNLLPFQPPEGLLGFTEFARSRVVLPFTGDYAEFRHTIRHEMVHVFQLSKAKLNGQVVPRYRGLSYPLWWGEGTAEYFSSVESTQDEMILRDLTQGGRLPTIEELGLAGGAIVYPVGGALARFLAERYGEWRLVQVFDDSWKYDTFDELMTAVFGRSLEALTAEWHYALRRRYYPLVQDQRPLALDARPLASLALKPAVWTAPGDSVPTVFYISPRTGYTNVYAVKLTGGPARTIVAGERTPLFESFHSFESRMDVSATGVLAFASRYMDRDALILWDVPRERVAGRYQFPDIVSILSPAWSPDGRRVAFSGLTVSGSSDLYLLDLASGSLERLSRDRYHDTDPSFSPDGTRLVFASDRTAFGRSGATNLFVMDLATKAVRYLTYGDWHDKGPRWSAEKGITFTSDRRGAPDVYVVDSSGAGRRETGVPGGAFDPVWVPSRGVYVLGGFEDLRFNIYALHPRAADPSAPEPVAPPAMVAAAAAEPVDTVALAGDRRPAEWHWAELDDARYARTEPSPYDRRFSVEFAGAEGTFAPSQYTAQGAQVAFADLLGDHLLFADLFAFQQGGSLSDIVGSINGAVTYINQSRRLNWGVGVFRAKGRFYENSLDNVYDESAVGAYGLLLYPLSRFTRVEGRLQVAWSDRTDFTFSPGGSFFPQRKGVITSNFLTWVHDNSLWYRTGPIDGGRERITGGIVTDLQNARFDSWLASADLRRYLRTGLRTAIAVRGLAYLTGGERPQHIALGGTYGLRGYPRFEYVTGSRALMGNIEWRFPLTDYLSFGLPFGELRFPGIDGAVFADLGKIWTPLSSDFRSAIGAYGFSFRMNIGFPLVLRLDAGWRFGDASGYQLPFDYRGKSFVQFWFGFDY